MPDESELRIGVYVCHCGTNIAGVVNVGGLADYALTLPNVVLAKDYRFMCSDPGQEMIKTDIKEHKLNRVVVAACSPLMHEPTFRNAIRGAGINPYLFEQANIREHDTWCHMHEPEKAYEIAKDLVRSAVAKASKIEPLEIIEVPVKKSCLIIGGGISGISAALDLAEAGFEVHLVEKNTTIGGRMIQLDKTFPTMDCSACILTPKMTGVGRHPNIKLHAYSEVKSIEGYVGNFKAKIVKKPRYVIESKCNGCGKCEEVCPVYVPNEFELGLKPRRAIYMPFPQAVPNKYTIDMDKCVKCKLCVKACEPEAIDFNQQPTEEEVEVGTIIATTGYDPYDPTGEYGYGTYENVVTGMQVERMLSAFGATGGEVVRPSDLKVPKTVAFIQCVGSRNFRKNTYCSRVCCMYATKHARQLKEHHPDTNVYVLYMDVRAFGKGYEEFYERAQREYGINYIRGRAAEVLEDPTTKNLIVRAESTELGRPIEVEADLVVLSVGLVPRQDIEEVQHLLKISRSADGFYLEAHPKLRPVDTLTDGIFIAGAVQGPKDIPDAVAQAKGAASGAASLMSKGKVEVEPFYSIVNSDKCSGCLSCIAMCPFGAILIEDGKAKINNVLCKGCGCCVATCPSGSITQNHFKDSQILAQIEALLEEKPSQ
jgi:heterodisulfide reductase subunit A